MGVLVVAAGVLFAIAVAVVLGLACAGLLVSASEDRRGGRD